MRHLPLQISMLLFCSVAPLSFAVTPVEPGRAAFSEFADGKQDATAIIAAALAKAGEAGGGEVYLPAGSYRINQSLKIPSGVTLRGETKSSTRLIAPQGVTFSLLSIDKATDVAIRNLTLKEEGLEARTSKGAGLSINDGSRFVVVENVYLEGFSSGFSIGRADKDESSNIVFRGCRAERTRSFGFELNNCREVLLDSCYAYKNWLDGIKFRKKTRDVTIRGGESSYNGTSRFEKPSNGNGVDAFAGGEAFLIDGLVTEHNQGSGIYMKTGTLNNQGFGIVGSAMITNVRCRYNVGNGLDINRSGGDLADAPLLTNVSVVGGIYEGNTSSGIYVRGRNVSIVAPIVRSNHEHGIDLASAYEVDVSDPMISGNGLSLPDGGYGIQIGVDPVKGSAANIRVRGGIISGADDINLVNGNDEPKTPVTHRRAIMIGPNSRNVSIAETRLALWTEEGSPVANPGNLPVTGDEAPIIRAQYGASK